jgi:hypothetical protein
MSRIEFLKQQAARAERLARGAFDNLTVERLKQAAKDYQAEAEQLTSANNMATDPAAALLPI